MDNQNKANKFYVISLLCGLWFLLFGTSWGWGIAFWIAYPPGLIGILFWYLGKKNNPYSKLKNIALGLLVIALIVSVTTFILMRNNVWVLQLIEMPD